MNKPSGFTLAEIGIALVIISLIFGAVIYGSKATTSNTKTNSPH